jgi:hypothetical protein
LRLDSRGRRLALLAGVTALVAGGYFAIGHGVIGASRNCAVPMGLGLDARTPFVPWLIVVYLSQWALWWVPAFRATRSGFRRFVISVLACNALAFVVFLLCRDHVPRQSLAGMAEPLHTFYETLYRFDPAGNTFPSLHAVDTVLVLRSLAGQAGSGWYAAWGSLIVLASVLTRQHVIADVVAGGILAYAVDTVVRTATEEAV